MKYNHAMAERGYKREWKAAKLEMRKAGKQREHIGWNSMVSDVFTEGPM